MYVCSVALWDFSANSQLENVANRIGAMAILKIISKAKKWHKMNNMLFIL